MFPGNLDHFLAVAQHQHFGRAAEALNLSQQALSKSIAALERNLCVKLFTRGQFGAVLTPYGEALRRRAKIIEAEMSLGRAEIESLRGSDKGSVRVGVGPSFVGRIMPIAMLRMHEAHPEVQIAAVIDTSVGLYPQLLRGELEFVVSAPATSLTIEPDIQREKLFLDRDCAVVRADHPLARKRKVSLADTQDYPWLLSARTGPSLSRVAREFTALGLAPPTRVLRTDSTLLGLELVRRGDCILLVSRENIEREMTAKQLVELDVPRVAEVRPAYIAKRQRSPLQPAAAQLLEHVRQVCFELYGHAN